MVKKWVFVVVKMLVFFVFVVVNRLLCAYVLYHSTHNDSAVVCIFACYGSLCNTLLFTAVFVTIAFVCCAMFFSFYMYHFLVFVVISLLLSTMTTRQTYNTLKPDQKKP